MADTTETKKPETPEEKELRELEQRIRDARARSAKIEIAGALKRKRLELEDAERRAKDDETLAKLEEEHGPQGIKIAAFRTHKGLVVVKRALGVVWSRYTASKMEDRHLEELIHACRVYPGEDEFEAILDELPALKITIGNKIGELFGLKRKEDEGK